ncbi:MAG: OprD family outer membrane porin [Campylobacterota bacterium]
MKLVKMSLAAAVMLGASAFAIDNVKVSGDAKLFYGTDNKTQAAGVSDDLFDQANSYADTALRLSVTADLTKNVSMGATAYAISTLGLENNLVANTWTNGHDAEVEDNSWMGELWLAGTMGKTTLKVGRMELDTPMAFSEKWSIVPNTFDAAVVINQDIPDTTLVGAWVGKSNGTDAITGAGATVADRDGLLRDEAKFSKFMEKGAYAAAIVNNSFKPLVAQAWYYNIGMVADAYWLQADIDCQLVKGVKIGAQYADVDVKSNGKLGASAEDSSAYAFKLAYQGIEGLNVSAAYSKADDKGTVRIQNVAAGANATGQSKLYTEAWWNYGYVGSKDAEALNLTAEYDMKDIAKFGVYYTTVSNDIAASTHEMDEVAVTATKSFGALDTTLAYISTNADDANSGKQYDTVQAYLTLKF